MIGLGIFLVLAVALVAPGLSYAADKGITADEETVVNAMRAYVKTVDAPLSFYHWDKTSSPFVKKFDVSRPEGAQALLKTQAEGFLNSNETGFYLANDPVTSRSYGGQGNDGYLLMELTVPKGSKFIEVENSFLFAERMEGLLGADCAFQFSNAITFSGGNPECNALKRAVFKKLSVIGLKYEWEWPRTSEVCPGRDRGAVVITDTDWIKPEHLNTFTHRSRGERAARQRIQELSFHATKKYDPGQAPLWADIPANTPMSEDTKNWMGRSILNCREKKEVKRSNAPADLVEKRDEGSAE